MKKNQLGKEDIGKKFTKKGWHPRKYFIFVGEHEGFCYGRTSHGNPIEAINGNDIYSNKEWLPYEEPKKITRIEAAHGFCKYSDGQVRITAHIGTYDEIKKLYGDELIQWPAQWDSEKGVWYYEWEE